MSASNGVGPAATTGGSTRSSEAAAAGRQAARAFMASDAGSALRRTFDAARAFAAAPPPAIALPDRDYIAAAPGNASNCHVAAPEGASNGHVAAASESASNGVAAAPENASDGTIDPYEQISQLPHNESDEEQRDDPSNTQQPLPEGEANELSPQAVPQLHCPSCENAITSIQDLRSVASVGLICSKCATSIEWFDAPLNLEAQKPQEPGEDGEGHVAAAPESAENCDVAVGQAVLSQKRKRGGRTGESVTLSIM